MAKAARTPFSWQSLAASISRLFVISFYPDLRRSGNTFRRVSTIPAVTVM
jgi:hypothetical protein